MKNYQKKSKTGFISGVITLLLFFYSGSIISQTNFVNDCYKEYEINGTKFRYPNEIINYGNYEILSGFIVKGDTIHIGIKKEYYKSIENTISVSCTNIQTAFSVKSSFSSEQKASSLLHISIKPDKLQQDTIQIKMPDTVFNYIVDVEELPEPQIYFNTINKKSYIKSNENKIIKARCGGVDCEVLQAQFMIKQRMSKTGVMINQCSIKNNIITDDIREFINKVTPGDYINVSAQILMPDSTTKIIENERFKVVGSELYARVLGEWNYDLSSPLLFEKRKNDCRIKFEEKIADKQKLELQAFIDELNCYLPNISVKVVDFNPNIIFKKNVDYNNEDVYDFFFPDVKSKISYAEMPYINEDKFYVDIEKLMVNILRFAGLVGVYEDSVLLNKNEDKYHLTNFTKDFFTTLYSKNGEEKFYTELGITDIRKVTKDYTILIVLISLALFLLINEFLKKYGLINVLHSVKYKLVKNIIVFAGISVFPLIVVLFIKAKSGVELNASYIISAALYYVSFACIVAALLWFSDKVTHKITNFPVALTLDFILTIIAFIVAYQVIFLVVYFDNIHSEMILLEWLLIPLTVAFYRINKRYNLRKIQTIINQNEFELSKQKELKTKAELLALQSRINPHFLYNSLNSIASLAKSHPVRTEQMAVNLAKFFRFSLNKQERFTSTIKEEIEMLKIYLEIEKQRFDEMLEYEVKVDDVLLDNEIPTFILQPLAENAVKHGLSVIKTKGIIRVVIKNERNGLLIRVYDNGPGFNEEINYGYGLQNIYDKLKHTYKDNFELSFVSGEKKCVQIKISL